METPQRSQLSILNQSPRLLPGPQLLHHLLHGHDRTKTAIDYAFSLEENAQFSYGSCEDLSNAFAAKLLRLFPDSNSREIPQMIIPVLLPQSPELYISLLAILKAGAAFCPMNVDTPQDRLNFLLEDISAKIVVTSSAFRSKISLTSRVVTCLADSSLDYSDPPADFTEPYISPSYPAYLMFTSGSTGIPKAVVVSHLAATQSLLAHHTIIPKFSRFLQFAAPTFDISIFEIFFTFFRGSTLVCCDRKTLLDNLPEIINRLKVDAAELTPTVAGGLLATRAVVPNLKLLLTIGEMLSSHVVEEFGERTDKPGILYGMYGPTEASMHCTFQSNFSVNDPVGLIGRPLQTVSAFIIRPAFESKYSDIEILPYGETGELALGGNQLADGYLNRADQTASAFVSTEHGYLYRTGDKAYFTADSTIIFLGRIQSGQVKLRGQRLEFGEVEQAVMRNKQCRAAVASIINEILVVFCLTVSLDVISDSILKECRRWLLPSQVPGDIVIVDRFPTSTSGKTDKKKLEADYVASLKENSALAGDEITNIERKLCKIAEKVLGHQIHPAANLAASGIDSLLAIQFASEARNQGIKISALEILDAGNIQDLKTIDGHLTALDTIEPVVSSRFKNFKERVLALPVLSKLAHKIEDVLPCTSLQASMLSETILDPQAYCNWVKLEFLSMTSRESIRNAVMNLVSSNDILRSGFCAVGDDSFPWARVLWTDYENCIREVEELNFLFELRETTMLRPLKIEICMTGDVPEMLICMHHAIYDGWSIDLILHDLSSGLRSLDPILRPQFCNITDFYVRIQCTDELKNAREYWTNQLKDFEVSRFPNLSGFKNLVPSFKEQKTSLNFGKNMLKHESLRHQVHPQIFFQTAMIYLLSRYIGSSDVVLGTVTSGRMIAVTDIEDIIGPCIATVPLRLNVRSNMTAIDLMQNIHKVGRESLKYSTLPLRDIKTLCNGKPGLPLFDVLFVWQETLRKYDSLNNDVQLVDSRDNIESKLMLEFKSESEELSVRVRYDSAWIPTEHIGILLSQIRTFVNRVLVEPSVKLAECFSELPQDLLSIENPVLTSEDPSFSLAHYVERQAQFAPDRKAIAIGAIVNNNFMEIDAVTFGKLNEKANSVAHFLIANRTGPEKLVAIIMDKSTDLYISILAVIKSGSGYLPLTTNTPERRVTTILGDANIRTCLVNHSSPLFLKNLYDVKVFDVGSVDHTHSTANPVYHGNNGSLAYAIYTSGSTGTPKGVLITQSNLLANVETLSKIYSADRESRLLQACSQAFDVSAFDIFFAWSKGICLCAASNDALFRNLEHSIRQMNITHLSLTPTVAALLDPEQIPKVRFLVTAGEPLTETIRRKWQRRQLFNGYGPAETTNICSVKHMTDNAQFLNNVGRPLPTTSVIVVDHNSSDIRAVPKGALGELCFGGSQVFEGYVNRPDLNSAKIVHHALLGRIYRSGDLGRLIHDGSIIIAGRIDDQIKIRGQRLELGEVHYVLMCSPMIKTCAVMVMHLEQKQNLVAFWVSVKGASENEFICSITPQTMETNQIIFDDLKRLLPAYMVPSFLVPVTNLPITSQGKVDKAKLTALFHGLNAEILQKLSDGFSIVDSSENWTMLEHNIASALSKLFSVQFSYLEPTTSFFSLGLDSINAISLAKTLRDCSDTEVEISTILQNPTPRHLAQRILELSQFESHSTLNPQSLNSLLGDGYKSEIRALLETDTRRIEKIRPCTPMQEALLAETPLNGDFMTYNKVSLSVAVDLQVIKQAWEEVLHHHEILRTCFVPIDDRRFSFAQAVFSRCELPLQINIDGQTSLNDELFSNSKQVVLPWSLVVHTRRNSLQLLISMHHALYDADAFELLLSDVEAIILNKDLKKSIQPDKFLMRALHMDLESADVYWEKLLKTFSPDFPRIFEHRTPISIQCIKESDLSIVSSAMGMPLSKIEHACRCMSTTLLSLCQAAWAKTLFSLHDTKDICFGNVINGRTTSMEGIERLIFPCFNTIPVRVSLDQPSSNSDLCLILNKQHATSLDHQYTPLRRTQSKWRQKNEYLFDTLLILQTPKRVLNRDIWTVIDERGYMGFPVVVEFLPCRERDELVLNLHYLLSGISETQAEAVVQLVLKTFTECVEMPQKHVLMFELSNADANMTELRQRKEETRPNLKLPPKLASAISASKESNSVCLLLRQLFSRYSGIPELNIHDDKTIFQLGLDSLNAIQIARTLRDLGYSISAADILEFPTVSELVNQIQLKTGNRTETRWNFDFLAFDRKHRNETCERQSIPRSQVHNIRPCTPSQAGMIAQFLHSDGQSYFNHILLHIENPVDFQRLSRAWKEVYEKHQILRTGFTSVNDNEHSFVMIQYNLLHNFFKFKDVSEITAMSKTPSQSADQGVGSRLENLSPFQALIDIREVFTQDVKRNLQQPAWRIAFQRTNTDVYIQLSIHHALYDSQSLHLLLRDARSSYSGVELLQAPPIDFTLSNMLEPSYHPSKHEKFWKEMLGDAKITKFPSVAIFRLEDPEIRRASQICSLSKSELRNFCRLLGISVQVVFQAAWASILSAYEGEERVIFGTVFSGMVTECSDQVAFPCAATLPLSCVCVEDKHSILQDLMGKNKSILEHQYTPLSHINRWSNHGKGGLFDTLLVYQGIDDDEALNPLWTIVDEKADIEYPLSIEIERGQNDEIRYNLTFREQILPQKQAKILLKQFDAFVLEFCSAFTKDSMKHERSAELISKIPAKCTSISSNINLLHEFVEASARQYPKKIALEFFKEFKGLDTSCHWTYQELDAAGNKVANTILNVSIKPSSLIAICFDKSPEAYFAILGILKAGCGFVALDYSSPTARQAFIVQDSDAKMLLSIGTYAQNLRNHLKIPIIDVGHTSSLSSNADPPKLAQRIKAVDTSYCLYTSGSTGAPKGCLISHENAVQAILSFQRLFAGHWDFDSRWIQFASLHFDVSVLEQYWGWSVGIRVISACRDLILEDLAGALRSLQITHIDLTPSLARLISPDEVPSLCRGIFITGGEQLKQDILDLWGPKAVIYNGYGPTETTIGVTMFPRVPSNAKPSNIGWQFDNVGTYVLKPKTTEVVIRGAVGELCISGKLVGKGYLNRQDLTKEKFPYFDEFGERIYRTGDLVRLLHNNSFDFLGRIDDQIKLRGQRVEAGEICQVILGHSAISDAVVTMMKHPATQNDLVVAFIIAKESNQLGNASNKDGLIKDILKSCSSKLPVYMVPSHILTIPSVPLTINNKADMNKLREIFTSHVSSRSSKTEERQWETPSERLSYNQEVLLNAIAKHLSIAPEDLSLDSNLLQLGMDSISVFSFAKALRSAGFLNAASITVMQNPIVGDLFKSLGRRRNVESSGSVIAAKQKIAAWQHRYRAMAARYLGVQAKEIEIIAPCTPIQQGIIARSLASKRQPYFNKFRFLLPSDVDMKKLRHAWQETFNDSQILRVKFALIEDEFVQVVHKNMELPWIQLREHDLNDDDAFSQLYHQWCIKNRDSIVRPFEIVEGRQHGKSFLLVHIFHALYDALSISQLFQVIEARYQLEYTPLDRPSFFEVLPYGPLREIPGAKEFWQNYMHNSPSHLVTSQLDQEVQDTCSVALKIEVTPNFEQVRRQLNVTHQALIQAFWMVTLQEFIGVPVTTGVVVSGRSIDFDDSESVIGPLFNTLPFHLHLRSRDTWVDLIKACHDFNISALPFQHTALQDIMKWRGVSAHKPLFDTLFLFQQARHAAERSSGVPALMILESNPIDYPLAFEAEQSMDGALTLTISSWNTVADQNTCTRLLKRFQYFVVLVLTHPYSSIEEVVDVDWILTHESIEPRPRTERITSPLSNSHFNHEPSKMALCLLEEIQELVRPSNLTPTSEISIFELGMDSIDAIKLSSRLKKRSIKLSVSSIMQNPNISAMLHLAEFDDSEEAHEDMSENVRKLQLDLQSLHFHLEDEDLIENILPATPLQEAMIAKMLTSGFSNYFNHDVLKISRSTDTFRLKCAFSEVIEHSPIFSTSFVEIENTGIDCAFALITRRRSYQVESKKIDSFRNIDSTISSLTDHFATGKIKGPVFAVIHLMTQDGDYILLSLSHALYDGWSLQLFHQDVKDAYHGKYVPRPSYDFQVKRILSESGPEAASFWQNYLLDVKECKFPTNSVISSPMVVHRDECFSIVSLNKLRQFCRQHNITIQSLAQTCWTCALSTYTSSLDVVFGVVLSGRDNEDAQKVLFPTMNTVAFRSIIHGTRADMLRYVQKTSSEVKQFEHYPLRKALKTAKVFGKDLFNTLFIYQVQPVGDLISETLYESVKDYSSIEFPVCVEAEIVHGQLVWRIACKNEVLSKSDAAALLDDLNKVLLSITEHPNDPSFEMNAENLSVCGLKTFTISGEPNPENSKYVDKSLLNVLNTWSKTEEILRRVLSDVSGIPEKQISKTQSIFHLGLDSIDAIKVASMLRKQNLRLTVRDMLHTKNIGQLCHFLQPSHFATLSKEILHTDGLVMLMNQVNIQQVVNNAGIQPEEVERVLPATAGQIYFLAHFRNTQGVLFYPTFKYILRRTTDLETLKAAWKILRDEEPILRTTFASVEHSDLTILQVILKGTDDSCTTISQEQAWPDAIAAKGHFTKAPVHLYARKAGGNLELRLHIHHALYDGVSLPSLLRRLEDIYNGNYTVEGTKSTYEDFLARSVPNAKETSKRFWTAYLDAAKIQKATRNNGMNFKPRIEVYQPGIGAKHHEIQFYARNHGVTLHALIIAVLATAYARLQDLPESADLVIGIYLANRSHSASLPFLKFPTVNVLPLLIKTPSVRSSVECAKTIQEDVFEISQFENSMVTLSEIAEWTGIQIDCIVNLIKLPNQEDMHEDQAADGAAQNRVTIEADVREAEEGQEESLSTESQQVGNLFSSASDMVWNCYKPTVDIEVAHRNGDLDMGIFAPVAMLSREDAVGLIHTFKSELSRLYC